jgi:hypothetical protein
MIRKSPYIPKFVWEDFKAKDNVIIGPTKIKQPTDTIPECNHRAMIAASLRLGVSNARNKMQIIDLIGRRFGRLVVAKRAENSRAGHPRWTCIAPL